MRSRVTRDGKNDGSKCVTVAATLQEAQPRRRVTTRSGVSSAHERGAKWWITYLQDSVSQAAVMLVVIGHHWENVNGKGLLFWRRRLHDPNDWVRIEIELAIQKGIPVIPVLVGQAVL